MNKIQLPDNVKFIIDTLETAGYEGYAVGGCVRDCILGREPNDWDITTNAKPYAIKELFKITIDTGIQHGTVTVLLGGETYEVTTYRIDGEYEDSRHPKQVEFTTELVEDLKRRDFTINAMAYNDTVGFVDEFDGIGDIERGIIRCVGNAEERFGEDALRIMRAVRFSAQLGFDIEENTKCAISKLVPNLKNISAERIHVELSKLMVSPNPGYIRMAYETGILKVILPELDAVMDVEQNNPHHCYTVGEHIIRSVEYVEADRVLRFAMLFHDLGKGTTKYTTEDGIDHFRGHAMVSAQMARNICNRLKFDNATRDEVLKLVEFHDYWTVTDLKHVRKAVNKFGVETFPKLLKVKEADFHAQSMYERDEKEAELKALWSLYQEILDRKDCLTIKELAITGKDLIEHGIQQGPEIGATLNKLLDKVLEEPELNTKEKLLELL